MTVLNIAFTMDSEKPEVEQRFKSFVTRSFSGSSSEAFGVFVDEGVTAGVGDVDAKDESKGIHTILCSFQWAN